jgi:hypothetical protein
MEELRIVLRLTHIFAGTFWVGAAVFVGLFLEPAIRSAGEAGGRVMERLVTRTPFAKFMALSSLLTIVAGGVLYYLDARLSLSWITSREGLIFTLGAITGLIAYVTGQFVIGPTSGRIGALGQQMAAAGGPPTPEQLGEMAALQARAQRSGQLEFVLMVITIAAMAGARLF